MQMPQLFEQAIRIYSRFQNGGLRASRIYLMGEIGCLVVCLTLLFEPARIRAQDSSASESASPVAQPLSSSSAFQLGNNADSDEDQDANAGQTGRQIQKAPAPDKSAAALRLTALLREKPDLLAAMRELLAQGLRDEGNETETDEIPERSIVLAFSTDAVYREQALRLMVARGDLTDEAASKMAMSYENSLTSPDRAGRDNRIEPSKGAAIRSASQGPQKTQEPFRDMTVHPYTVEDFNPYPTLPSAVDLYKKFPEKERPLRRFGADIFRPDNVGMEDSPMDIPAGSDYVLGPGDTVQIDIWGGISQRVVRVVDREGRIALPAGAPASIAGLTSDKAQKVIETQLREQFHDAHAALAVTRLRTVRIYVVGDVQRPGAFDISALSTPLNALYAAGGPTSTGSLRVIRHYRGEKLIEEFDLYDLLIHGVRKTIEHLEAGDTIMVPPTGPLVSISGMVRRPAVYELKGATDISSLIDTAGGFTVAALLSGVEVERIDPHARRVTLEVPQTANANASSPLGPFALLDGDQVKVRPILPFSEQQVYLTGHVYRAGKYPYKNGMTVADLIRSYQDVLPEPSMHGELIHLRAPDFHPVTQAFDLSDVLSGSVTIPLEPLDTVKIYGRYEVDPPRVSIFGEVLRPGKYPMQAAMTVRELIEMAGGLKRSAYTEVADVASYSVDESSKVEMIARKVDLKAVLNGDKAANLVLQPGDTVSIRQLTGWNDIGSSARVAGEVAFPGTYGIREGEHLSSLLKRIGGFRPSAYLDGAVLDRVEVKEREQVSRDEVIQRIEQNASMTSVSASGTAQDQEALLKSMQQQQQMVLAQLRQQKIQGRLVVHISADISQWENTAEDIELRAGDELTIPKNPQFILVYGQVYNPSAFSYSPGKNARWYLEQSGGCTEMARCKASYVIRASGELVANSGHGFGHVNALDRKLNPGDTIVVPEKLMSGSLGWRVAMETAQTLGSLAIAASVVKGI